MNGQDVLVITSHGFPENETVVNHSIVQGQVVADTVKNLDRDTDIGLIQLERKRCIYHLRVGIARSICECASGYMIDKDLLMHNVNLKSTDSLDDHIEKIILLITI